MKILNRLSEQMPWREEKHNIKRKVHSNESMRNELTHVLVWFVGEEGT